jgi:predicted dinucleotide-binding enzyme
MKLGIIGAGNVGTALATASVRAGHDVRITSADGEAERVASEVGARAAASNAEASKDSDAVILAVPFNAVQQIVDDIGAGLDGKVLIDVTNRFSPDQLDGTSNAELTQKMVPKADVIKAFNTVFAGNQDDPNVDGMPLDGFVAGKDGPAKQKVLKLVESLGFHPIDAGPLEMSRALEGMGMLNISLNQNNNWPWQSGWKLLGPTAPS